MLCNQPACTPHNAWHTASITHRGALSPPTFQCYISTNAASTGINFVMIILVLTYINLNTSALLNDSAKLHLYLCVIKNSFKNRNLLSIVLTVINKLFCLGSTFLDQIFHLSPSPNSVTYWDVQRHPTRCKLHEGRISTCFICCVCLVPRVASGI